ncbi:hypothetical protein OXYTRIMIC_263 [Oxytricha trifallax]|uniref:Uncharacterized protein n=1 Tax=Oxytricha trifallax TaxID=1172189 RepID=A0A073IC06_9SPIT|nr:hypothetical protein OXYTRIMIC_263 [Oxytricha trifallax]
MQRYYLKFNLEVGLMKLEIGISGISVDEKTIETMIEQQTEALLQKEHETEGAQGWNNFLAIDVWDEMVLENGVKLQMELIQEERDASFNAVIEEGAEEEDYLFSQKSQRESKEALEGTKELINPN